jgi:hypothetical protein
MGFFDRLKLVAGAAAASSTASPVRLDIVSPLSESQMHRIVWSDVFGTTPGLITREQALALPAVFKARAVLLALLADKPLIAYDERELFEAELAGRDPIPLPFDRQPAWLRSTAGAVSPWHRMAVTLDDIVFYGWCLWTLDRDDAGEIVDAVRVPMGLWKFDELGRVMVKAHDAAPFEPAVDRDVLLIPGPSEGLLAYATRSLEGASDIEDAWVDRAKNPIPVMELHQTVESNLKPEEAKATVDDWNAARRSGGAAFTPYDIEAKAHGIVAADLYIEGRNAGRLDVGNYFNLPASLLDGSVATASLTYSTQEGDANEVALYSTPYWSNPITGRLSQDDVAGAGIAIRHHLGGLVSTELSPTGGIGND